MRIPDSPPPYQNVYTNRGSDLAEAMKNPDYLDLVRDAADPYRHWHKLQFIARDRGLDPELAWAMIAPVRGMNFAHTPLQFKTGQAVKFTLTSRCQQELMQADRNLAGQIAMPAATPLTPELRDRFVVSSLMDEAITSSMLEGASTTYKAAKDLLRSGRSPRNEGETMVLNAYSTLRFAIAHRDQELTPAFLIDLQRRLTVGTLDDPEASGRLRKPSDDIVVSDFEDNILHTPPHALELDERLERLCEFANSKPDEQSPFIHPLLRGILIHLQIGFDHPFCDGNGRTARTVFYWYMIRNGYWLFEFLPLSGFYYSSPAKYARAYLYSETDDADATYFIEYNLRLVRQARQKLTEYLSRKRKQLLDAERAFRDIPGLNHRQQSLLMHSLRHPGHTYTIESHKNSQGVAYATARSDLFDLADKGLLTRSQRGKTYEFRASSALIERGFSA